MLSKDGRGQVFVMVTPWLRVTLLDDDQLRFNIVTQDGRVFRGPQIGLEDVEALMEGIQSLAAVRGSKPVPQPWILHGSR